MMPQNMHRLNAFFMLTMVVIATLNVCGMRNPNKRKQVYDFCRQHKFDIVCLQESHITHVDETTKWEKEWGGQALWSLGTPNSRGVGILLSPSLDLKITKTCSFFLH